MKALLYFCEFKGTETLYTVDISTHSEYRKTWYNYFCGIASGMFPVLNSTVIAICRIKCNFVLTKERHFYFIFYCFSRRGTVSEFLILHRSLILSDVS